MQSSTINFLFNLLEIIN